MEAITTNPESKAALQLEHAAERLEEVRVMILQNKIAHAQKAQAKYAEKLEKVNEQISKIDDVDKTKKLEKRLRIQNQIQEQEKIITAIQDQIASRDFSSTKLQEANEVINEVKQSSQGLREDAEAQAVDVEKEVTSQIEVEQGLNKDQAAVRGKEAIANIKMSVLNS